MQQPDGGAVQGMLRRLAGVWAVDGYGGAEREALLIDHDASLLQIDAAPAQPGRFTMARAALPGQPRLKPHNPVSKVRRRVRSACRAYARQAGW
ncbi:hypothetical protein GCM10023170_077580 [Phytohabitans houttuyneae]|uniref:Uncharacterized protein n=1 Tax=Phytohabitans houttuyneae TaxID=1076126 RepID=A0A6V8KIA5_9ACTN|nr:hypothetical protein Phou_091130 [Phytohabitans houttuyneae]